MSYENIQLPKANFVIIGSYFYTFDETKNALVRKVDDGSTAFEYPTDTVIGTVVINLQFDGYYFWTMQEHPSSGLLFKKWRINNFMCRLSDTFEYINDSNFTYSSETFGVEYYTTVISSISSGRTDTLSIDEYYDTVVASGTKLFLGPNDSGDSEIVVVSGVVNDIITLDNNTTYKYTSGDSSTLCRSFFMFNNYNGTDDTTGALMRFDAYTGDYLVSDVDVEYRNVQASVFYRFQNILPDYPDAHSLTYVKGTNVKLRDMSDLINIVDASSFNEDFTAPDYSIPDATSWSITNGDPKIINNELVYSTSVFGHDSILSNYNLLTDFAVQVSGTLGGITTISGMQSTVKHYMYLDILEKSSYELGVLYMEEYSSVIFEDDFTLSGTNWQDISGVADYSDGYLRQTNAGDITQTSEQIAFGTNCDIVFKFKNHGTGTGNDQYYVSPIYVNVNDSLTVFMYTNSTTNNSVRLTIGGLGSIHTNYKYNYYDEAGSWFNVHLIRSNNDLYFNIWKEGEDEPESWDYYTPTYGQHVAEQAYMYSDARKTSVSGTGLDNIVIKDINNYPIEATNNTTQLYLNVDGIITERTLLCSGIDTDVGYLFQISRSDGVLSFEYKTTMSGIHTSDWELLSSLASYTNDCKIGLGLHSSGAITEGAIFDDLIYLSGSAIYPLDDVPFYGVMNIDNVKPDKVTVIDIYALAANKGTLYRLQKAANYYDAYSSWSTYNYQTSPIRPFLDFVTIGADPVILPANGKNVSVLTTVVQDQYGNGTVNTPVSFTDDNEYGYVTTATVNTDPFYGTGKAVVAYKTGLDVTPVIIECTATQYI